VHTKFPQQSERATKSLVEIRATDGTILKLILRKLRRRLQTGFGCNKTSSGLLRHGNETSGFIRRGIYRPSAQILTLQEGYEVTLPKEQKFSKKKPSVGLEVLLLSSVPMQVRVVLMSDDGSITFIRNVGISTRLRSVTSRNTVTLKQHLS
jgi:hypothetical protein